MNSTAKRCGVFVLALVMCAAMAASSAAETTITFLAFGDSNRMRLLTERVIPSFEAEHPGVKVQLLGEAGINEATQKLMSMIAGGVAPDIAYVRHWDFPDLVRRGLFVPLDDMIEKADFPLDSISPTVLNGIMTYQGRIYGLPYDGFGFNVHVLYVNKDLFEASGVSVPVVADYNDPYSGWSYDEFRDAAKRLTVDQDGDGSPEIWGASYGMNNSISLFQDIWNFGGDVIDRETLDVKVGASGAKDALEFLHDMKIQDNLLGGTGASFRNGKTAINKAAFNLMGHLAESPFDWTIVPLPHGPGGRWGGATGNPLAISATSENKELAFAFVQHFLSDEVQFYLPDSGYFPPQTRSAVSREEFLHTAGPPYDKSPFIFGRSRTLPIWVPGWSEVDAAMLEETRAYFAGESAITTTLENLRTRITQIVQQHAHD